MESIYYVMAWACHRKCRHCYEERFRPYVRGQLDAVVREAEANYPRIVDHFPARMTYLDQDDPRPDGTFPEKTGRIVLSGGETLIVTQEGEFQLHNSAGVRRVQATAINGFSGNTYPIAKGGTAADAVAYQYAFGKDAGRPGACADRVSSC